MKLGASSQPSYVPTLPLTYYHTIVRSLYYILIRRIIYKCISYFLSIELRAQKAWYGLRQTTKKMLERIRSWMPLLKIDRYSAALREAEEEERDLCPVVGQHRL